MDDEKIFKTLSLLIKIIVFVFGFIVMVLILQKNLSNVNFNIPENVFDTAGMLVGMPSVLSQADISKGIDYDLLSKNNDGSVSYFDCSGVRVSSTSLAAKRMNGNIVYTLVLSVPDDIDSGEYVCRVYFNNTVSR